MTSTRGRRGAAPTCRRTRARLPRLALLLVAALGLAACTAPADREGAHEPPRNGSAGLQLSGTFGGRQLALSDGAPSLLVGNDCARRMGIPDGLCIRSRDIDGTEVLVGVLNPSVVRPGAELTVGRGDCRTPETCGQVTDVVIVDVQVGGQRQRATGGTLSLRQVIPGARYVGATTLTFRDGRLAGGFDVVPRPDAP